VHGGPDAFGVPRWDFSTNANACGPCPEALAAVQAADASRYPDPRYTALRAQLAAFHGVASERVLLGASASECIHRLTAWQARLGARCVGVPAHAYGEYAQAARAWGLEVEPIGQGSAGLDRFDLLWACEPASPLGGAHTPWPPALLDGEHSQSLPTVVLDRAYAPLHLSGTPSLNDAQLQRVWQLFSPNKALGLTGVRAAYAIAPLGHEPVVAQLDALAPSWAVGAHGVAMLEAWTRPEVQAWLDRSRTTLRQWKARQLGCLSTLGWTCRTSGANFFCAQPVLPLGMEVPTWLSLLRAHGVKLRDAASFGLPGWVRLGVLEPAAQDALLSSCNCL
jgi:histidinol-phosphate aminotransferase